MAQNMIIAAESLGLGTCLLGAAPYMAKQIKKRYQLPEKVFPLVQLIIGYPAENPAPRPRYPMDFVLFTDGYPELDDAQVQKAMDTMDYGYLSQSYYANLDAKIDLTTDKKETYDYGNYSWTEHISRKWGQWHEDINEILEQLELCGFKLSKVEDENK